jgi:type II secretory pathway pseudopilin PulG
LPQRFAFYCFHPLSRKYREGQCESEDQEIKDGAAGCLRLTKRMGAMHSLAKGEQPQAPSRNFFAWLLAAITPRFGVGGGAGLVLVIAMIGILAAVAIPAYQQYVQKAKVASAYSLGLTARTEVAKYYYSNNSLPDNLASIGVVVDPNKDGIADVELNPGNGEIKVYTGISSSQGAGILVMSPSVDEQKQIQWQCSAEGLDGKVLPEVCR